MDRLVKKREDIYVLKYYTVKVRKEWNEYNRKKV